MTWAGFYAGTIFGFGDARFRSSQTASRSTSKFGQTGGALVGYNFQSGNIVYGLEGDITLHLIRTNNAGAVGLIPHADDTLWSARARARLGYDLGNLLPFVAGGIAVNESYQHTLPPIDYFGDTKRRTGFTLGAGVDYRFTPPIFNELFGPLVVRLEYVYENFPRTGFSYAGNVVNQKLDTHFVRLALISTFSDTKASPAYPGQVAAAGLGTSLWNGAYAGVMGGGGWTRARTSLGAVNTSISANGGMGGLYAGRNFQFGKIVVGFEGSTMLTSWRGTGAEPTSPVATYRNYIQADTRVRLGYAAGAFLPFIAGGVTFGRSEQVDRTTGSERGRVPTESLTIGAGLDYRLSDRWSVRAEYLYERTLRNVSVNLNGCACTQSRRSDMVRAGLAYHFQ